MTGVEITNGLLMGLLVFILLVREVRAIMGKGQPDAHSAHSVPLSIPQNGIVALGRLIKTQTEELSNLRKAIEELRLSMRESRESITDLVTKNGRALETVVRNHQTTIGSDMSRYECKGKSICLAEQAIEALRKDLKSRGTEGL